MFPFLELPYLAQVNILSSMKPSKVYFLTLFYPQFRQVSRVIKWAEIAPKACFSAIDFSLSLNERYGYEDYSHGQVIFLRKLDAVEPLKVYTINGEKLNILADLHDEYIQVPVIKYDETDYHKIRDLIIDHFNSIFRYSSSFKCTVEPGFLNQIPEDMSITQLTIFCEDDNKDPVTKKKELDNFFDTHSPPEMIAIVSRLRGDLSKNKKLMSVKNICVYDVTGLNKKIISKFTGQDLLSNGAKFTTQDVVGFIRSWVKGGYENLNTMWCFHNATNFDLAQVLNKFEWKEWDENRRAGRYTKNVKYHEFYGLPLDVYDCTDALDIERETDGLLASFKIFQNFFLFNIWRDRFPKDS